MMNQSFRFKLDTSAISIFMLQWLTHWGIVTNIYVSEECHRWSTVYPKKYAHGYCFAVLCCGYTLIDFPISIRLTSLALWQSNDCPSASKATLMNIDKYFMWIHYERLHNHNKAKHNKIVCIFLGIYCMLWFVASVVLNYNYRCLIFKQTGRISWTFCYGYFATWTGESATVSLKYVNV